MKLSHKQLLMFGPLTIIIEWVGFVVSYRYSQGLDFNNPISLLSVAKQPLPLIFSITLLLAGISFFIFSLALRSYSKNIIWVSLFASIMLSLTGWAKYSGQGGIGDLLHNIFIYSSLAAIGLIIWMMKKHPHKLVSTVSEKVFVFLMFASVITMVSIYVHRFVALVQLLILFVLQFWVLIIVRHSKSPQYFASKPIKKIVS